MLLGLLDGHVDLLWSHQIQAHTTTVVGVKGLDYHRIADAFRSANSRLSGPDENLTRDGQTQISQDLIGLLFIRRDVDGYMACLRGNGGLDSLLIATVSELDQRVVVETNPGNVTGLSCPNQRGGRGSELTPLCQANELFEV